MVREIIDMAKLATMKIDGVATNYQVRWDNTLLLTAYDQEQTFILTTDGERLLLRQRLRDVLRRFADENTIHQYEMEGLYKLVGCRTRGYIAGHHRLVPTCGQSNQQVIYYMVHFLDHAAELVDDKRVELLLKGSQGTYHVLVDTSYRTFRRIVSAADQVAKIQLRIYEYCRHQYGKVQAVDIQERPYESDYCVLQDRRRLGEEVLLATILAVIRAAHFELYGETMSQEFIDCVKRVIKRF